MKCLFSYSKLVNRNCAKIMAMRKYFNQNRHLYEKLSPIRGCTLRPLEAHVPTITLSAGANTIGRSQETGIRDVRCSKRQLQLDVNLDRRFIKLRVLGVNPCGVNGLMAMQNSECELEHGDVVEVVYGRHAFEVVFRPPPETKVEPKKNEIIQVDKEDTESSDNKKLEQPKTSDDTNTKEAVAVESWDSIEDGKVLIYTSAGVRASKKIAAYDMDGTIIKTRSGNVFPKTCDDWEIIYAEVPRKLRRLHQEGYKICFFTNQGGIAKGKVKLDEFKQKVLQILRKLGVPVQVYIAISDGYYRKPLPGMWEHLEQHKNASVRPRIEKCFYVGDAAGRPELSGAGVAKRRKDHSLADRFFAHNIGVAFYTPEEHFLSKKAESWTRPEFEPSAVHGELALLEPNSVKITATSSCEMIIMVGLPGSGKSHFTQHNLAPLGYTLANADTLGSTQACLKVCQQALSAGKSCVVDNTNVDAESRKKFIALAAEHRAPCRCFVMNATLAQVRHNIAFRQLTDPSHTKINEMVLNVKKKKYQAPTLDEGFTEIARVNLKPTFSSAQQERLYKLYLVDK